MTAFTSAPWWGERSTVDSAVLSVKIRDLVRNLAESDQWSGRSLDSG